MISIDELLKEMPEGPEARVIAEALCAKVEGKNLVEVEVFEGSRYFEKGLEGENEFVDSFPQLCRSVYSKGKKVIFDFDGWFIVCSLGMEGKWAYKRISNHSNFLLSFGVKEGNALFIETELYFDDTRKFGSIELIKKTVTGEGLDLNIGPDLLNENVSLELFTSSLLKKKNVPLARVLLLQEIVAGIGNYLRAEIMYHAKVYPMILVKDLTDEQMKSLWKESIRLIRLSYENYGLTIKTFFSPEGKSGKGFDLSVYRRKKDPFGNDVEVITDQGRSIYFCPSVQN